MARVFESEAPTTFGRHAFENAVWWATTVGEDGETQTQDGIVRYVLEEHFKNGIDCGPYSRDRVFYAAKLVAFRKGVNPVRQTLILHDGEKILHDAADCPQAKRNRKYEELLSKGLPVDSIELDDIE